MNIAETKHATYLKINKDKLAYSMPHILTNGQTAHNTVANTKSNN